MHSFTSIVSFLALSGAAVSAMNLVPALPRAEVVRFGKRAVQCGGGVYCQDNYSCVTGTDGEPGCCPVGWVNGRDIQVPCTYSNIPPLQRDLHWPRRRRHRHRYNHHLHRNHPLFDLCPHHHRDLHRRSRAHHYRGARVHLYRNWDWVWNRDRDWDSHGGHWLSYSYRRRIDHYLRASPIYVPYYNRGECYKDRQWDRFNGNSKATWGQRSGSGGEYWRCWDGCGSVGSSDGIRCVANTEGLYFCGVGDDDCGWILVAYGRRWYAGLFMFLCETLRFLNA